VTAEAAPEVPFAVAPRDDLDARWALVLPHRERLRRIAARRLSCRDEVDDVVQEAMLRAVTFERLDPAYAGQFLSTVTVRLCADVQRERARQLRVGVRDALRTVEPGDPHDTLLDTAEARWLYGECLKLPPRESAVMLARASGMSVKETASTLGVGTKSAEAALTKARHRMRRVAQSAGVTVLGVLRRAKWTVTPGAAAVAVTAVTVGGVVSGVAMLDRQERRPAPVAAAPAVAAREAAAPAFVRVPKADPAGIAEAVVRKVRAAVPPDAVKPPKPPKPGTTYAETPPVGDPEVAGTKEGATVTETHEDETIVESLSDCLTRGPSIDPSHFLCDDSEQEQ
jgi:RNA polymerase sigma-70 factor (ECF subfamily)